MNHRRLIALIALNLLFLCALPVLRASETKPEATIAKIRTALLDPNFTPDGIEKMLTETLNAALAILPQKEYTADVTSKVDFVKASFAEKHLFSDKIRQDLGVAYRLVADGAAWQLPEEIKSAPAGDAGIKTATQACARYLEKALAEMKAGNNEAAVRHLFSFVLMVVTPIRA